MIANPAKLANGANSANSANPAIIANPADLANSANVFANPANIFANPALSPLPLDPILLSPAPCGPSSPFLLVLVPSAPSHWSQRQAIRDTWASGQHPGWVEEQNLGLSTRTLFVLGLPEVGGVQEGIRAESSRYADVLQGSFSDTYANLTRKTLLLLRWAAARCPSARFVLKADDDVFVNLPALTNHLAALRNSQNLYLGRVHWWVRPNRLPDTRHHVPVALFPSARFPPYCSGTAYVLGRGALVAILQVAHLVPLVAPEDVWVGLCARRAGVSPRHSGRMAGAGSFPADGCCFGEVLFSAHRLSPTQLREVWGVLARGGGGCSTVQRVLGVLRCKVLAAAAWLWE
ncbi:beta-1,3-galactosyltransferase 4 [Pterocles gutturalis]